VTPIPERKEGHACCGGPTRWHHYCTASERKLAVPITLQKWLSIKEQMRPSLFWSNSRIICPDRPFTSVVRTENPQGARVLHNSVAGAHMSHLRGIEDRGKTVTKPGSLSPLGLALSEKQIPQVVEKFKSGDKRKEALERTELRPRQVRYQAALRPDNSRTCSN